MSQCPGWIPYQVATRVKFFLSGPGASTTARRPGLRVGASPAGAGGRRRAPRCACPRRLAAATAPMPAAVARQGLAPFVAPFD